MKIWKWIVGLLAMLGGAAAVASTQNKKKSEHTKKVKENQNKIKTVRTKTKKVEAQRAETKKAVNTQKKKVAKAKCFYTADLFL